ncbi:hypothetical protein [Microbacterium amylolyticum]|uniref:Sulfate permease n=1 Tax=Microbacterium amylolyticum TaxID=936337 RepID=A0ABS4ZK88_9MICO|nr:hypothetical protein [Microbacterium amylolyticum]MBP2437707.1 hypothetical protein [Microbacterium amylolyticum]
MFRLLTEVSIHIRNFLRRYMRTNILADAILTRRGMNWGPAVMLLSIPYFAAAWLTGLIDQGAPGWLHLLDLLTIWNGFKMLWLGPASVAWLIRARLREADARRRQRVVALSSGSTVSSQSSPRTSPPRCSRAWERASCRAPLP